MRLSGLPAGIATFAVLGIVSSEVLLIVLTVTAAVQRLLRRSPRVTGGQGSTLT